MEDLIKTTTLEVEKKSKKNITLGTILGYVSVILNIVSGFIFTPWIIASIGKGQYGIYTLSTSLVSLFLLDFGLSATANTFLSKYKENGDTKKIESFLGLLYKCYFVLDLILYVVFLVIYKFAPNIYSGLTSGEINDFQSCFLVIFVFSLISFPCTTFNGILSAYEEFICIKVIDIVNRLLFIGFSAFCILTNQGLFSLVVANCLSSLICLGIKYLIIRNKIHIKANFSTQLSFSAIKPFISFSLWATVVSICSRLVLNITPNILGIVSDSENIAIFGIASTIEGYVYTFSSIMSGLFLPKIMRIIKDKATSTSKLNELSCKIGKIQLLIIGILFIGFLVCGKDFIIIWMHGDTSYIPAYYGIVLMIIYQLFHVPQIIMYTAMFATENVKYLGIVSIFKAIINCILCFILSYFFGAIGACISIMIARIFQLFFDTYNYKKRLGIQLIPFFKAVFLKCMPALLITTTVGFAINIFLKLDSLIIKFIIEVAAMCVVYAITSLLLVLSKSEKQALKKKLLFKR